MNARQIAIIGYGTAGQACALMLSRAGHQVEVFERAPVLGPVGAGLLLQPTGLEVLWRLGLFDGAMRHGARVRRLHGCTPHGREVMDMRYAGLDPRLFGIGIQRGALFELLRRAWPGAGSVRCGLRIVEVDCAQGTLRDDSGHPHGPYDLVVIADGAASSLRGVIGATRIDQPYPWGALWCLCPARDWQPYDVLQQRYVAARKMVGMLPVGTRPDDPEPKLSFFWSLPVRGFETWERNGIAPWKRELGELWPEVLPHLDGIDDCSRLARASYRDAALTRWSNGRAVVVGDAAHSMSPQLGQGVNMALMDAEALCRSLHRHAEPQAAVEAYERERRAHVAIYQFWSRWLTPVFQSDRDLVATARDLLMQPMGRMPGGRGTMLRVLSGTQHGWLGRRHLAPQFLQEMARAADARQQR